MTNTTPPHSRICREIDRKPRERDKHDRRLMPASRQPPAARRDSIANVRTHRRCNTDHVHATDRAPIEENVNLFKHSRFLCVEFASSARTLLHSHRRRSLCARMTGVRPGGVNPAGYAGIAASDCIII